MAPNALHFSLRYNTSDDTMDILDVSGNRIIKIPADPDTSTLKAMFGALRVYAKRQATQASQPTPPPGQTSQEAPKKATMKESINEVKQNATQAAHTILAFMEAWNKA
ncbi:MAG: hypothetical protein A2Y78_11500 [Acidobacteria bacterium RBG_13_68_16]|nr:MAG: hypothetical protein A2Y78_11500 [Acidobacteria bacterium RBG_13_68_16]